MKYRRVSAGIANYISTSKTAMWVAYDASVRLECGARGQDAPPKDAVITRKEARNEQEVLAQHPNNLL